LEVSLFRGVASASFRLLRLLVVCRGCLCLFGLSGRLGLGTGLGLDLDGICLLTWLVHPIITFLDLLTRCWVLFHGRHRQPGRRTQRRLLTVMVTRLPSHARRTQRRTLHLYSADALAVADADLFGTFFQTWRRGVVAGVADEVCFAHSRGEEGRTDYKGLRRNEAVPVDDPAEKITGVGRHGLVVL
jgi:hypothetical protein